MKFCSGPLCKVEREDEAFSPFQLKIKHGKCRECKAEYRKILKGKRLLLPLSEMKKCCRCGMLKSALNFSQSELIKPSSQCMECIAEYHELYAQNNPEKIRTRSQEWYNENKEEILIKEKEKRDSRSEEEKAEMAAYQKQWVQDNKEKFAQYQKQWAQDNKERLKENRSRWCQENKTEIFLKRNKQIKIRKENEPAFKLRINISSKIAIALKQAGSSKNKKSILDYLPNSINEIREYLEQLFSHPNNLASNGEVWMNWNNWGRYNKNNWNDNDPLTWTWQLDHIIPQSDLPYTSMEDDNFKKCWTLDNLRPYSAKQNVIDGVNRTRHMKKDDK